MGGVHPTRTELRPSPEGAVSWRASPSPKQSTARLHRDRSSISASSQPTPTNQQLTSSLWCSTPMETICEYPRFHPDQGPPPPRSDHGLNSPKHPLIRSVFNSAQSLSRILNSLTNKIINVISCCSSHVISYIISEKAFILANKKFRNEAVHLAILTHTSNRLGVLIQNLHIGT